MNVFQFAERYHISRKKAQRIAKENPGWFEAMSEGLAVMRESLANGDVLTAAQLCALVEAPADAQALGSLADKAQAQIAALGRVLPAPREIVAIIGDAAKNDPEAVAAMTQWLRETIPAVPVGHSFIAVRLLLGLAPNIRHYDVPRIPRALLNCRRRPELAGWWRVEAQGARNVTIYQRPKITLAEFDL